jgi:hypothetical protein
MKNNTKIKRDIGNCGVGSVGGFFSMRGTDARYGISNNHVLANLNNCKVGDAVESDDDDQQIGKLSHWIPLKGKDEQNHINYFDMALFKVNDDIELSWQMQDDTVTKPMGFIEPRAGGNVYMMIDNGNCNKGKISKSYINHIMEFDLCGKPFLFTKLIEITPLDGGSFSVPGDSGSIILSSSHYVVGLLLGTNSDATRSYAIPFVEGLLKYVPLNIL